MPTCQNNHCRQKFDIIPEDQKFHDRMDVPSPKLCPSCRRQRRMAFRNERKLYHRKCDLSGKQIISVYAPDSLFKVYSHEDWWSDKWDARDYGQDFDFSRPFFEQFAELQKVVPRMDMIVTHCENCDYAPYSVYAKNCYMSVSLVETEDTYYSYQTNSSRDCIDCGMCWDCELCYECLHSKKLFRCAFCQYCENSDELYFCQDCRGCSHCIGCKNLVNQKYHIFNKPVSPEEFEQAKQKLSGFNELKKIATEAHKLFAKLPQRAVHIFNCENATGNDLHDCKNVHHCFDAVNLEDCAYLYNIPIGAKDTHDAHYSPKAELVYDSMSTVNNYNTKFALHSWDNKNVTYADECFFSHNLFGCVGLKRQQYCIFNKQYSEKEYVELRDKIIQHMQKTQEWGEFFPIQFSIFAYNETIAQDYFPLTKEEILARSWQWRDEKELIAYNGPKIELPDNINDVEDSVCEQVLICKKSGKNYKIIPQELAFYRKMKLPTPRRCPEQRYRDRLALQNPRELWNSKCKKCGAEIQSTYKSDRQENIYCEKCYLKEVY